MPIDIQVNGVPFRVLVTADGFYITAVAQDIDINGSPLIVHFDPPVAPDVGVPQIIEALDQLPHLRKQEG